MKIIRVYNNNVVAVFDNNNIEAIAIGRGLAYLKKAGEMLDESKIDKIFTLKDRGVMTRLHSLIADIPTHYLTIAEEIVEMVHDKSSLKLNENFYITLIDHISMSIEREKNGTIFQNPFLREIKQLYKVEFELAMESSKIIYKHTGVNISDDEAGFITLHIVNASMGDRLEDTMKMTRFVSDIVEIVENFYNINIDESSINYERFIRHLQFLTRRIFDKDNRQYDDDFLHEIIKQKFPSTFICVNAINHYVKKNANCSMTDTEKSYLAYHIKNITTKKL